MHNVNSVIYNTRATDNEERSADLFMAFAKECFNEVPLEYACFIYQITEFHFYRNVV